MSGFRFYDQLDENEKRIYDAFSSLSPRDSIEAMEFCVELADPITRYSSDNFVYVAWYAFAYDHPLDSEWYYFLPYTSQKETELTWYYEFPGEYLITDYYTIIIEIHPLYTYSEMNALNLTLEGMTDQVDKGWSRCEKARYIQNVVSNRLRYDWNREVDAGITSSVMCLRSGIGICEGYSKVYKCLADIIDLPCVLCNSNSHMFVLVQMEDVNWYIIEPQGEIFLQGQESLQGNPLYFPLGGPAHWEGMGGGSKVSFPQISLKDY